MTDAPYQPPHWPQLAEFLRLRRSTPAQLLNAPAPEGAVLEDILTSAMRVPDHGKLAPWRIVVHGPESRAGLAALTRELGHGAGRVAEKVEKFAAAFDQSPLVVAVLSHPVAHDAIPLLEQQLSAGAVCLEMMHAAMAHGFGANWLSGWMAFDPEFLSRAYGITAPQFVAGFIHLGTPSAKAPERPRPEMGDIVTFRD